MKRILGVLSSAAISVGPCASGSIAQTHPLGNCYLPAAADARPACLGAVYLDGLALIAEVPTPALPTTGNPTPQELLQAATDLSYGLLERVRRYHEACRDLATASGGRDAASEFVKNACSGFDLAASVDSTANAQLIATLKGEMPPQSFGAQVEQLTAQRQSADASSRLMILAGISLMDALLEPNPGTDRMRLAMTPGERDALVARAQEVARIVPDGQQESVYNQIAGMLASNFFSQPWPTR